jgi:hypothetical protein
VKLDPATAASDAPRFFEELPAALKSQDLTLVKSEQSDVAVLASLKRVAIPVDGSVAKYDVAVSSSGKTRGTFAGSDVLSAKGLPVQGACRENSEWLEGQTALAGLARLVTKDVLRHRTDIGK